MVKFSAFVWRETDLPHRTSEHYSKSERRQKEDEYRLYFCLIFLCILPIVCAAAFWRYARTGKAQANPISATRQQAEEIATAEILP